MEKEVLAMDGMAAAGRAAGAGAATSPSLWARNCRQRRSRSRLGVDVTAAEEMAVLCVPPVPCPATDGASIQTVSA